MSLPGVLLGRKPAAGGGGGSFVGYRTFSGGEWIDVAGETADTNSTFTLAVVGRPTTNGSVMAPYAVGVQPSSYYQYLYVDAQVMLWDSQLGTYTTGTSTTGVNVANGWQIFGCNKATGTSTVRFHRSVSPWSTTAHENGGTVQNGTAPTSSGFHRLGGSAYSDDFGGIDTWQGDIAVIAMWDRQLSDAEWATLGGGLTTLLALGPVHAWRMDQSTIADLVGNADEISKTGTPDISGSLSPFPT